jgi:hypothetical protein
MSGAFGAALERYWAGRLEPRGRMAADLAGLVSTFGWRRCQLSNPAVHEPEDQLRSPLEGFLVRVLDAVHWPTISKGDPNAWLYFYEDFLSVYDNALRKQTGSYYTPVEVVDTMVRLVDEALRSPTRFNRHAGLASADVRLCAEVTAGLG